MKITGSEICRSDRLADEMRFADPGPLNVGENDRDDVALGLQSVNQRVDIGRGLIRRWTIIIDYLEATISVDLAIELLNPLTRMCMIVQRRETRREVNRGQVGYIMLCCQDDPIYVFSYIINKLSWKCAMRSTKC